LQRHCNPLSVIWNMLRVALILPQSRSFAYMPLV
jgi:hypothetical protein